MTRATMERGERNATWGGSEYTPNMNTRSEKAMEASELRERMAANDKPMHKDVAEALGVHRMTVGRWLAGEVNINAPMAALIRERLPKTDKKKK